MVLTAQNFVDSYPSLAVVLKAKNPEKVAKKLKKEGFKEFVLVENMYMDEERILKDMPEEASYFSVLIAKKL